MDTRGPSGRRKGPPPAGATADGEGGAAFGGYGGPGVPAASPPPDSGPDRAGASSPHAPLPGAGAAAVSASASAEERDGEPSSASYYESRPPRPQHHLLGAGGRPDPAGVRSVTEASDQPADPFAAFEPPQSRPPASARGRDRGQREQPYPHDGTHGTYRTPARDAPHHQGGYHPYDPQHHHQHAPYRPPRYQGYYHPAFAYPSPERHEPYGQYYGGAGAGAGEFPPAASHHFSPPKSAPQQRGRAGRGRELSASTTGAERERRRPDAIHVPRHMRLGWREDVDGVADSGTPQDDPDEAARFGQSRSAPPKLANMPRQEHDDGRPQRKREAEPRGPADGRSPRYDGGEAGEEYPQAHRALRLAFRDEGDEDSPLRNLSSTSDVVDLASPAKRPRTPSSSGRDGAASGGGFPAAAADYAGPNHTRRADEPFCRPATTAFPLPPKTPHKGECAASGTPGVNVTAETAELSYADDDGGGGGGGRCLPAFPVSSVKRHPAETSGEAWGSPPRSKEGKDRHSRPESAAPYHASPDGHHTSPGPEPHTGSWSPSALEAFANEDHIKSGQYRLSQPPPQQPHHPFFDEHGGGDRRSTPPAYGGSELTPNRGGVAIRGSPISTRAEREEEAARRDASTPAPGRGTERPAPRSEPAGTGHRNPAADGAAPWTDPPSSEGRDAVRAGAGRPPPGVDARGVTTLRGSPVESPRMMHESPRMMPPPHPRYYPGAVYGVPSPYGGMMPPAAALHSPPAMAHPQHPSPQQPLPAAGKENNTCSPASSAPAPPPPSSSSGDFKPCSCKKSKCLKLYCECFKAQRMCGAHCKCVDCHNSPMFEDIRNKAIADTIAKKPRAFDGTIASGACKCKNTFCLKKYCECYSAGILCGDKCKCVDCKNYLGSEELIQKRRKDGDMAGLAAATAVAPSPAPSVMAGAAAAYHHHAAGPYGMHPAVAAQYGYQHGWRHPHMPPGMMAQGMPAPAPAARQPRPQFVNESPHRGTPARRRGRQQVPRQVPAAVGGVRRPVALPSPPRAPPSGAAKPARRHFGPDLPATSDEVAMKIFAFVDNESRFTSSLACKEWNDLVKQSFQR